MSSRDALLELLRCPGAAPALALPVRRPGWQQIGPGAADGAGLLPPPRVSVTNSLHGLEEDLTLVQGTSW